MLRPKKKFGQNFLVNSSVLPKIIEAAKIKNDDTIIEIGPGTGVLTEALLSAGAKVFAIEKDFDLIAGLTKKFGDNKKLKLVHQDALFFDETIVQSPYKVVANLPFNMASPLIRKFLESTNPPEQMVVMVQKEVAEKILAKPGDSERGILTISVEFFADAEMIVTVSKNSFRPQPKVDAAIIKIKPKIMHSGGAEKMVKVFFRIVKAGFSAKRQMIHNSLAATLRLPKNQVLDILKRSSINSTKRAEDLSLDDWINLTKTFESTI